MKRLLAVLKAVADNRSVRARAYEAGIAVLGVAATSDALDGVSWGTAVKGALTALLVVARTYVPPKA